MPRRAAWRLLPRGAAAVAAPQLPPPPPHPSLATVTPTVPPHTATTAAAWLRARSPLALGLRSSLFRRRAVRLVPAESGAPPRRVSAGGVVPPGAALAVPASALLAAPSPPSTPPSLSPASAALAAAWPCRILATTPDFWVVAKKAGEHTQSGGPPSAPALDAAAAAASPGARLVHRLDVGVSGAIAVARHAGGAAWLSAALAAPAAGVAGEEGRRRESTVATVNASVTKTYLALVDGATYGLPLVPGSRGVVDGPLPLTPTAGGAALKAVASARAASGTAPPPPAPPRAITEWRALAVRSGWALLVVRPITGRKHQIRKVAAGTLGAPVAGDDRYGVNRSPRGRALDAALEAAGAPRPSGALLLHCAVLSVRRNGVGTATARAGLPPYFQAALRSLGWHSLAHKYGRVTRGVVGGEWWAPGVPRAPRSRRRRV